MVKVELFKNLIFNNSSIMSNFANYQSQKEYFDNVDETDKVLFEDVKIKSLNDPILLESELTDLFEFTYGRIIFGENKRIVYFSINRFEIERVNKTWVYIDIDYWETYRYPISQNSNGLKIGRCKITRCSLDLGCKIIKPYTPQATKQKVLYMFHSVAGHTKKVIFTYHSNVSNKNYIYVMETTNDINDLIGFDFSICNSGDMDGGNSVRIDPESISGCWIDPIGTWGYTIFNDVWTDGTRTLSRAELGRFNGKTQSTVTWNISDLTNYDSARKQIAITDMLGNIVWVSDGFHYEQEIKFSLNVTMTTARWFFYIKRDGKFTNGECRGTIPCEPCDIFSDTFTSYAIQQRPFLEESRRIQKDQAAINGLAGIGTNAIGGAVAGSMVAPGPGTVAGAVGGAISSLIGTGVSYLSSDVFNKAIQESEDKQALVQTDNLRFEGSAIGDYLRDYCGVSILSIENDDNSYNQYVNDVSAFGYYYNTEYSSIDSLMSANPEFKLTANAEIENVPAIAVNSIKARLSAGVILKRPVHNNS